MTAVVVRTAYGPMLVPPYDQYVGQSLIRAGAFSPAELHTWMPYILPGFTVLDVGANIGAHTLAFAALVGTEGRVYAIEPQPQLFFMLCGSLALNGIPNVIPKNVALARERDTLRFPHVDYSQGANFGGIEMRGFIGPDKPGTAVAVVPLDEWALARMDFLKIDVEGMEPDVLHGATETITRCRPVISAEADREQNVPALLGWFRLNGYKVWWHRPPLNDALFPRIVSANLLALPREREDLPVPESFVEPVIE